MLSGRVFKFQISRVNRVNVFRHISLSDPAISALQNFRLSVKIAPIRTWLIERVKICNLLFCLSCDPRNLINECLSKLFSVNSNNSFVFEL